MTRRADRRHYAILGALAEQGPSNATELCQLLNRGPGTVYPDLVHLEQDGRVVSYWGDTAPGTDVRRRMYRLPTDLERLSRLDRPSVRYFDPALTEQPSPRRRPRPAHGT